MDHQYDIPTCRQPHQLPEVLSPGEVAAFLDAVKSPKQRVILTVCYAAGLRVSEAVRLKPAAIDSQRMVIRVEAGKGRKDRYVMLSPRLLDLLRDYWKTARPKEWLFPGDLPGSRSRRPRWRTPAGGPVRDPASHGRSRRILCATHSRFPAGVRDRSTYYPITARSPQSCYHGEYLRIATSKVCATASPLDALQRAPPRRTWCPPDGAAVPREGLEVADVFRRFGPAFRDHHGASLSVARWRAMTAIESCARRSRRPCRALRRLRPSAYLLQLVPQSQLP